MGITIMSDNQQLTEIEQSKADAQELVRLNGLLTTAKTAAATAVENAAAAEFGSQDAITEAETSKTKAQLVIDAAQAVKDHAKSGSAEHTTASEDVTDATAAFNKASELYEKSIRDNKEYLDELNRLNGLLTAANTVTNANDADVGSTDAITKAETSARYATSVV